MLQGSFDDPSKKSLVGEGNEESVESQSTNPFEEGMDDNLKFIHAEGQFSYNDLTGGLD